MFKALKPFVPLLAIIFLMTSCQQSYQYESDYPEPKLVSVNIIDREGMSETFSAPDRLKQFEEADLFQTQPYQKVLRVYERDVNGDIKALITSYHPNGTIKQYLEVLNNRAHGEYREWYADGTLKVEAFVVGGEPDIHLAAEKSWLFDGRTKAWDIEGRLEAEILYAKGELNGDSLYYHPNGAIWKKIPFVRGQIDGSYQVFLASGEIFQTMQYCQGKKQGPSLRYWPNQTIAADEMYENDLLISGTYFNFQGEQICSIVEGFGEKAVFGKQELVELQQYQNGVLDGQVKVFDQNQKMIKLYHIKNGLKHGEEILFREKLRSVDLIPYLSIHWYEGKIHGMVRTWFENGVLESQKEYSQNAKTGLSTAWYRDGSLMLVEEYEKDKLIRGDYFRRGERSPLKSVINGEGEAVLFDADGHFLRKILYHKGKPLVDHNGT